MVPLKLYVVSHLKIEDIEFHSEKKRKRKHPYAKNNKSNHLMNSNRWPDRQIRFRLIPTISHTLMKKTLDNYPYEYPISMSTIWLPDMIVICIRWIFQIINKLKRNSLAMVKIHAKHFLYAFHKKRYAIFIKKGMLLKVETHQSKYCRLIERKLHEYFFLFHVVWMQLNKKVYVCAVKTWRV